MAAKKKATQKVDLSDKEALDIARIAHAAQREADLIDQIENQTDDFKVQPWEFVIPREKRQAKELVKAIYIGGEYRPEHYPGGKVFEAVVAALS